MRGSGGFDGHWAAVVQRQIIPLFGQTSSRRKRYNALLAPKKPQILIKKFIIYKKYSKNTFILDTKNYKNKKTRPDRDNTKGNKNAQPAFNFSSDFYWHN